MHGVEPGSALFVAVEPSSPRPSLRSQPQEPESGPEYPRTGAESSARAVLGMRAALELRQEHLPVVADFLHQADL